MSSVSPVADAICHSGDNQLISVFKGVLKSKGISNIVVSAVREESLDALKRFPNGLLIVHWTDDTRVDVVQMLAAAQGKENIEVRPTLLVAAEVTAEVVATAMEYNVTQMHVGEIVAQPLIQKLGTVLRSVNPSRQLKGTFRKVDRARSEGKLREAGTILEEALKLTPNNLRLRAELAENYFLEQKFDECLEVLQPLLQLKPPYLRALHIQSRCLLGKGEDATAISLLQQANLFNPHNVERLCELGDIFLKQTNSSEAGEVFDQALAIEKGNKKAAIGKGHCLLMEEQVNEALELVKDMASPRELASMFNMSAILSMRRGDHATGMRLYDAALGALKGKALLEARLHFNKGIGYQRMKDSKKARQCFEAAVSLDPGFGKAKQNLGRSQEGSVAPSGKDLNEENLVGFPDADDEMDDFSFNEDDFAGTDVDEDFDSDLSSGF